MRKVLSRSFLAGFGWNSIARGKTIVSYCDTCSAQRVHTCTGLMEKDGDIQYRFECLHCRDRLDGRLEGMYEWRRKTRSTS